MRNAIDQQIIQQAKRRVGFKIHFTVFVIGIFINWIVWALTDTSYMWPIWPTIGWSIGILFHYLGVFHSDKFFSINKEAERLSEKNNYR